MTKEKNPNFDSPCPIRLLPWLGMSSIAEQLTHIREQGLWRELVATSPLGEHKIERNSKTLWNFASNDYLGLASHPAIREALIDGLSRFGHGAGASRLICGSSPAHHALEEKIAACKGTDRALLFSSGFAVAIGTIPALLGKDDVVILDKLSHACLIDAARLSGATVRVFPHNDLTKLEKILRSVREKYPSQTRILIITESVFSMDGDTAPLAEMVELKEQFGALLLVDEAHGFGVLGDTGAGLSESLGLRGKIDLQMGTLSKAAGLAGGFLAASGEIIDLLVNRARSLIYSTAPPPALAWAACRAVDLIGSAEGRTLRSDLQKKIRLLTGITKPHASPIIPLIIGSNENALQAAKNMANAGFLVPAIRYPTVPKNSARLRLSLSATHPDEAILALRDQISLLQATNFLS